MVLFHALAAGLLLIAAARTPAAARRPDCVPTPAAQVAAGVEAAAPLRERGPSARALLRLAWDLPVPTASGRAAREPLAPESALDQLAGEDPRPLLILRECYVCLGTDDGLLSRRPAEDERTQLLARWFHCVRLPPDVLERDHPFRALFPNGTSDHLVLLTRDGSLRLALDSQASRTELWGAMGRVLRASRRSDPLTAVERIQELLGGLDELDEQEARFGERLRDLELAARPEDRRPARVLERLARARAEREALLREIVEVSRLDPAPEREEPTETEAEPVTDPPREP